MAGIILAVVCGCQKSESGGGGGASSASGSQSGGGNKLIVWSFTDELNTFITDYYKGTHPDVTIEYSFTPTEQFPNKLDPVLAAGQGAPDVFGLEDAFVRKYVESGLLLDLTDVYQEVKDKMIAYPIEVGSYNGKVYGLSWQATPGGLFYRRSLAKKYLGTDDPPEVQKRFSDMNKFIETAELLKSSSFSTAGGKCVVISAVEDLIRPYLGARKQPWVVDNALVIDSSMLDYMDTVKLMRDRGYEGRATAWQEGWFAGMRGELKDETGNPVEVFAYFLPTWGLHYVLKQNAPDTSGDWAMIPGPAPYRWGGTWIGAWKNTKNPAAAKEFIRYIATDDAMLEHYALKSGDLVGNLRVVEKIKDSFSEPFLGGQNHYAEFAEMAQSVNGKMTQGTDQAIEALFNETVLAYINGEKTKEKAIADFKDQVNAQLGL
jgi:ABC-type glycerol-3-phosphate transport system substrate-binding protein